jgi:hypothetical protein
MAGMKFYLGIMMSPPLESSSWSHSQFTSAVKTRMLVPPFDDFLDKTSVRLLTLRREAAYLVDILFVSLVFLKVVIVCSVIL